MAPTGASVRRSGVDMEGFEERMTTTPLPPSSLPKMTHCRRLYDSQLGRRTQASRMWGNRVRNEKMEREMGPREPERENATSSEAEKARTSQWKRQTYLFGSFRCYHCHFFWYRRNHCEQQWTTMKRARSKESSCWRQTLYLPSVYMLLVDNVK